MSYEQITIRSHDQTHLQARIYPASSDTRTSGPKGDVVGRVAIIAHPYGFLGGSMHDHVVQALKDALCQQGIHVLLYNSRGVGKSQGRASWTGEPERRDYQAVADWLVNVKANEMFGFSKDEKGKLILFCCGYSYGSLMACCTLPPTPVPADVQVDLRFVMISPPLSSFIGFLLTPFRVGQYMRALLRNLVYRAEEPSISARSEGLKPKVLIVYGTRDNFTQIDTYRSRIQKLREHSETFADMLSIVEVNGADHFWTDPKYKSELLAAVCHWL